MLPPRPASPPAKADAAKAPAFPEGPPERAQLLIALMERLADLLQRETEAISAREPARFNALAADKQKLAGRMEELGRLVRLDRAGLAGLPVELRQRLRETGQHLDQLSAANEAALRLYAEAQRSVVDVVVGAVNRERGANASYAAMARGPVAPAVMATAARAYGSRSMALNTRL